MYAARHAGTLPAGSAGLCSCTQAGRQDVACPGGTRAGEAVRVAYPEGVSACTNLRRPVMPKYLREGLAGRATPLVIEEGHPDTCQRMVPTNLIIDAVGGATALDPSSGCSLLSAVACVLQILPWDPGVTRWTYRPAYTSHVCARGPVCSPACTRAYTISGSNQGAVVVSPVDGNSASLVPATGRVDPAGKALLVFHYPAYRGPVSGFWACRLVVVRTCVRVRRQARRAVVVGDSRR